MKLCYAGSIHEQRGLYRIAEATAGLTEVETTFAGWIPRAVDGDFLRMQGHIHYLGRLEYGESLALIRRSHAVLALYDPSWPINTMASSNKVFEAMAAGRPVITNEETTMARIVREEQCGCLVPYGDPVALRRVIRELLEDPDLRNRLGGNGLRAFRQKYHWGIMDERLRSLYRRLFAARSQ
jgi:glycosyltransferase involved in cell wall biosynthesis